MTETQLGELANALPSVAREAGNRIMEVYNRPGQIASDAKADKSPLTEADRAAHEYISEELARLAPDIPLLSEEGAHLPYEIRQNWGYHWLVDPLDGTKEFLKRNGEFTVNIALIDPEGVPVVGCVYAPALDRMYLAWQGGGAFRITEGVNQPIHCSVADHSQPGLRLVCSRSHMTPEVEEFVNQYKDPELVSLGSSLKLVMIAEGQADVYPRLAPTMEWDTAAAHAIVTQAGGRVYDYLSTLELRYNKQDLLNPWFVVEGRS